MKKLTIAAAVILCFSLAANAQPTFEKRHYEIRRLDKAITVDGVIDAAEWANAKPMTLDYETSPGNNVPAKVKTEAMLGYDDKNLYVAIRAFDPNPAEIRAHLTDRDSAYSDDFAGVVFDTFNDERRAFEFFVNPLGVQMDLTNNDLSGNEDDSWDAIWSSAGKIHSDRYEIEMAIPFSQLRFRQSDGTQMWGVDILRVYPRDRRYRFGLHAQNRNQACYVCQFSKLTGFRNITPGRNVEIAPTLTSHRTDARPQITSPMATGSFDTEPGVTTRWGITPNLTLSGAINPDFSQVEADSPQLDINNTFALFFNEKRPFFLEGADFFETPFTVVYTRTVAAPDWGAKVTGKEGAHGGGVFVARDAQTNLVLPGSQRSRFFILDQPNNAAVLRYRYDVGKKANLGVTLSNRSGGDYANRVGGIDGNFRVTEKDTIQAQFLTSQTKYPDAIVENFEGAKPSMSDHAAYVRYRHNSRHWYWNARVEDVGTDFRADTGYMPRVGYRLGLAGLEHIWYPADNAKTWWSRAFWGGDFDRTEEKTSGIVLEQELETWFGFAGPRQSYVSFVVGTRDRHFDRVDFNDEKFVNFYGEFTPWKQLFVGLEANAGDQIDFTNVQPATRRRIAPQIRYRVNRNLDLRLTHQYEQLNVERGRLYDANLSELRAVYQFNVRMFVRALVQYTDIQRNIAAYKPDRKPPAETKELFPQLLFSYKLNPQTVLFVGYSSTRLDDETIDFTEADRTLFVKVGYAWAM